jgi:UDP-N-acetyl-2-amino-2-deoxyglucuronate dehydrogenase
VDNRLGIGIIGCGGVSKVHGAAFKEFSDLCQIVAVCDVVPALALGRMKEWNASAVYDDYHNLLADDRIDAVSICTPHYLHAPVAIDSTRAGKHVIVEKPMSISVRQATEMIHAARENGVTLGGIFQNQYTPNNRFIHREVVPLLGEIQFSYLVTQHYRDAKYYARDPWRGTWEQEGGGVFVNQAIHAWDMFQSYNGGVDYAIGYWANILHPTVEVEDIGYGLVEFKNGSHGKLFTTTCWRGENEMVIQGEHGRIVGSAEEMGDCRFELEDKSMQEKLMAEFQRQRQEVESNLEQWGEGHKVQIRDFLESIVEGREPLVTGESARESIKMCDGIHLYGWPYAKQLGEYVRQNFALPESVEAGREQEWDGGQLRRRILEMVKDPERKLEALSSF